MMMSKRHDDAMSHVRLPLPPGVFSPTWAVDMDVYVRFMRAMRGSIITKPEQKLLVAITTAATQMANEIDESDVALTLVELGLRAPRGAFPASFVNRALDAHMRFVRRGGDFKESLKELLTLWGLPVAGSLPQKAPSMNFSISSIPRALQKVARQVDMQNLLGISMEPVL